MRSKHAVVTAVVLAVATVAVTIASPALAGDGRCDGRGRIVFTRVVNDGIPNLFSTSPCGGAVVQLTTSGAHHADISRHGRWIAYDSVPSGQSTTDVFIARADGSQARDLTNSPATSDVEPDISPDGMAIAYSTATSAQRDARIAVLDLRSGLTRLAPVIPGSESFDPSWSPSGRWIVFDTLPASGNGYLWVVRSDGTDLHRITDNAADACQPDWGPNDLIAYTGGCDQLQSHLFVRDLLGLFVHELTRDADGGSSQLPAFSPDGRSLTYSRFDASFDNADIWRLDLQTHAQTNLVDGPTFDYWSAWGGGR
jgi:dipeptidyl aminopeptidase/acylaminoacyl peptidase